MIKFPNLKNISKELPTLGGVALWSYAGNMLDTYIPASVDPRIVAAAKAVIGVGLTSNKSKIVKGVGYAMTTTGVNELVQSVQFGGDTAATTTGVPTNVKQAINGAS